MPPRWRDLAQRSRPVRLSALRCSVVSVVFATATAFLLFVKRQWVEPSTRICVWSKTILFEGSIRGFLLRRFRGAGESRKIAAELARLLSQIADRGAGAQPVALANVSGRPVDDHFSAPGSTIN